MFGMEFEPPGEDERRIAQAIVLALNQLLPPDFETREGDRSIDIFTRGKCDGSQGLGAIRTFDDEPLDARHIAGVVEQVMRGVQDVVTEDLTWPWPAGVTPTQMADCRAEISDGQLRLWFEAAGSAVTPVAEVPLTIKVRE